MPVIKVWCLPKSTEDDLRNLHKSIVSAVVKIKELRLSNENDMTVLFPQDMMNYGLGQVIIIETSLFRKPERSVQVLQRLAKNIGEAIKNFYPDALIESSIESTTPEKEGFWTSSKSS